MYVLQERWRTRCQDLGDWVASHDGALPPSQVQLPCGFCIGHWLKAQKRKLRNSRLAADLVHELDLAAPGWRSDIDTPPEVEHVRTLPSPQELEREDAFVDRMEDVAAYVDAHDRFPRNRSDPVERQLAGWLSSVRTREKQGRITPERVKLLDATILGWRQNEYYDEHDKRWNECLAGLVTFVNDFGRLPKVREGLGPWLSRQRSYLRTGALREDRGRALDAAVPTWKGRSKPRVRGAPALVAEAEAVSEKAGAMRK